MLLRSVAFDLTKYTLSSFVLFFNEPSRRTTCVVEAAPPARSGGSRINKLEQALHENNTDQFNIDAKEWRA